MKTWSITLHFDYMPSFKTITDFTNSSF